MLKDLLTSDEFETLPEHVVVKVEKALVDFSEQYINTKALFETYKRDKENRVAELECELATLTAKNNATSEVQSEQKSKVQELIARNNALNDENWKLKNEILRYENEAGTFRTQRDDALEECRSLQTSLNRRITELEATRHDYDALTINFKAAIEAKVDALTKLQDLESASSDLEFREGQMKKEKNLLVEQIERLTDDMNKRVAELTNVRRDYSSQVSQLQTQLKLKTNQILAMEENEANFKTTIQELNKQIETLQARLIGQTDKELQLQKRYNDEIEERNKLVNAYKEMSEESKACSEKLTQTLNKMQKLLSESNNECEQLKRELVIAEETYKQQLDRKNEAIAALKKELADVNNLLNSVNREQLTEKLEEMSPHAAAAYSMIQKGLTLTQMYTEFANSSEQLLLKTQENEQLKNSFEAFVKQVEKNANVLQKRNEEYSRAMEALEKMRSDFETLEMQHDVLKTERDEHEQNSSYLRRDNDRLQKIISDLSRQICYLLKEVEVSRGADVSMELLPSEVSTENASFLNSSDMISKKLVTFRDIEELQEKNKQLLKVMRDLTEDLELAEQKIKECNKQEYQERITELETRLREREEQTNRQEKLLSMLKNQMKAYQLLHGSSNLTDITDNANKKPLMIEGATKTTVYTQTIKQEIDDNHIKQLQKELETLKSEMAKFKEEEESKSNEQLKNERMLLESLERAEKMANQRIVESTKLASKLATMEENCRNWKLSAESNKIQVVALERKCSVHAETIAMHEKTIAALQKEAVELLDKVTESKLARESLQRECLLLRESESRFRSERDLLERERSSYTQLHVRLESIGASIERDRSEILLSLDRKLELSNNECSSLRRRLQDEQDRHNDRVKDLEGTIENLRKRLEEETKSNFDLLKMSESFKNDVAGKSSRIEELEAKLKASSTDRISELEKQLSSLQTKYEKSLLDVEHQKDLVSAAKKDMQEFTSLAENFEKQLVTEQEAYKKYKAEAEARITQLTKDIAEMQRQNGLLQTRVKELTSTTQQSFVKLIDELNDEKRKTSKLSEELDQYKEKLSAAQLVVKNATESKLEAEKKYADELLLHSKDVQELKSQVGVIVELNGTVARLTQERDEALRRSEEFNANWAEQEARMRKEMEEQRERLAQITQQNEVLLDDIQRLSVKMTVASANNSSSDGDLNISIEDVSSNTDNLLQVISYLRKEKNLATSQLDALSSENIRLKSQVALTSSQLNEIKLLWKEERDKMDLTSTTAAKHAELVNKVQTLNALSDSNRMLREENERLAAEVCSLQEKYRTVESEHIIPLKEEKKQLEAQLEATSTENAALHSECQRWRSRVSEITDKMNKNSLDLLKIEREAHNKTLEDLRAVKQDKVKLEDQIKKLQIAVARVTALEKERNDLQKELTDVKLKRDKFSQDFTELQKTMAAQEAMLNEMKSTNTQVRSIAKKYKTQYQELSKTMEELKSKQNDSQSSSTHFQLEVSAEEQARYRQEGRQQTEIEFNDRIRELSEEVVNNKLEIENLKTENKRLNKLVVAKDVRAADILKQARTKIVLLSKESKQNMLEAKEYKERMERIEGAKEEGVARQNVIISAYENRISKMEKEKIELQADRDKMVRDLEQMQQKLMLLQRAQQAGKVNIPMGQEKISSEPPTANIKPMAGPSSSSSSSASKSQQNQQSVTVTPWRSATDPPLASVRPMSIPPRTAAVLPTSQNTSAAVSQSTVAVSPQQQLVDTSSNAPSIAEAYSSSPSSSSHPDFCPSTSSTVNIQQPVRQLLVNPTQQTSHIAESTQDMDGEELELQISVSNQVSPLQSQAQTQSQQTQQVMPTVALVLPRIDLQLGSLAAAAEPSTFLGTHVTGSNQSERRVSGETTSSSSTSYFHTEDSNPGQVSGSNNCVDAGVEQSLHVASSGECLKGTSGDVESSSAGGSISASGSGCSSNNNNGAVTTSQTSLKRARDDNSTHSISVPHTLADNQDHSPQVKRIRGSEGLELEESIEGGSRYLGDVEYQVPTSSQRDQEFDALAIDSEGDDEQPMPDDGIMDVNVDDAGYVEDEEVADADDYGMESYGQDQDSCYGVVVSDTDEDNGRIQDQDNEAEITEESNVVPTQQPGTSSSSGSSNFVLLRCLEPEQQSSEATSSGNSSSSLVTTRAQSASISSNQPVMSHPFSRRPNTISPIGRQQNQLILQAQNMEEGSSGMGGSGDDSIVPSTPTLFVPRRTDGFSVAVSSPHTLPAPRFTFNETNDSTRAGPSQMMPDEIDDTRIDLSEDNDGTGRSVPSTPLQSSPQDVEERMEEVGQSIDENRLAELEPLGDQQPEIGDDILADPDVDAANNVNEFEEDNDDEENSVDYAANIQAQLDENSDQ